MTRILATLISILFLSSCAFHRPLQGTYRVVYAKKYRFSKADTTLIHFKDNFYSVIHNDGSIIIDTISQSSRNDFPVSSWIRIGKKTDFEKKDLTMFERMGTPLLEVKMKGSGKGQFIGRFSSIPHVNGYSGELVKLRKGSKLLSTFSAVHASGKIYQVIYDTAYHLPMTDLNFVMLQGNKCTSIDPYSKPRTDTIRRFANGPGKFNLYIVFPARDTTMPEPVKALYKICGAPTMTIEDDGSDTLSFTSGSSNTLNIKSARGRLIRQKNSILPY